MSLRSNSSEAMPFLQFVSHRTEFVRRSNSLTSPLSNPARTDRSSPWESPNATAQQSRAPVAGSETRLTTAALTLVSQTLTHPSLPPVTISGACVPPALPMPSIAFTMPSCAWTENVDAGAPRSSGRRSPPGCPLLSPPPPTPRSMSHSDSVPPYSPRAIVYPPLLPPNVEHLIPLGRKERSRSVSAIPDLPSSCTQSPPLLDGETPVVTTRAVPGAHLLSCGVKPSDLLAYSIMHGASVVFIFLRRPVGKREGRGPSSSGNRHRED
mmetsp:Transcript_31004/g.73935  ORF Transcript_31004/g.73935 Transcript_31004/m.73935 type:complete len:267 (-) Transcript_31004:113-913(-)